MAAPFSALQVRLNRIVATHLANTEMVFADGAVAVVFGATEDDMPPAMGARNHNLNQWQACAPAADFLAITPVPGMSASIAGADYIITDVSTDTTSWMTLKLRKAA